MIDFLLRPLRRNFGRDKTYYRIVDDLFGFVPHNIELYKLALIHKSASLVLDDGRQINNERLEYLGDAVIEAHDVSKAFGDRVLYEHLEFSLPPAGIVGVIGPNGTGKSTIGRILAGL